jgi:hypothetical protein
MSRSRFQSLGERESGTARLEEAVAAFRAALEERTRERVPLDWATSTGSQGEAPHATQCRSQGAGGLQGPRWRHARQT